jgi:hypothetical protein
MEVVMPDLFKTFARGALVICAALAGAGTAFAQEQAQTPSISGDSWVAIAIVLGLVVLIFLFIGGALSISRRDKTQTDDGIGIIGPEEEDD